MKTQNANSNLHAAKNAKKDEFYTQLADIENELKHYNHHFKNKVVYCNCDDPRISNFFRYFAHNFERLGLKKLITTLEIDVKRVKKTDKQRNLELLEIKRPDLFDKVLGGKLSVYKAMIEGGFKKKRVRLRRTPTSFGNYIKDNFTNEEKKELLKLLRD